MENVSVTYREIKDIFFTPSIDINFGNKSEWSRGFNIVAS